MFTRLLGAIVLAVTVVAVQFAIGDTPEDRTSVSAEPSNSQTPTTDGDGAPLSDWTLSLEARNAHHRANDQPGRDRSNSRALKIKDPKNPATSTTTVAAATTLTAAVGTTSPTAAATPTTAPRTAEATSTTTTVRSSTSTLAGPGVDVFPGESIQAVVDANPAGTTFYLRAGVHSGQSIKPRDGDKFIGESGAILDGRGDVEYAFKSTAGDVLIENLIIEGYATPAQWGAVAGGGTGWTVRDNEIHHNWGAGIDFGSGYQVIGNYVHHNRQIGIKGHGTGVLVEGNEIAFNNYRNDYSMGWEAGGTKFLKTVNLVVRGNYVHDNHGAGLWTDYNNIGTLYENNIVEDNYGPGIFHEISYDAIIRNNRIEGNAFLHSQGGIKIVSSSNVEIYGNTLKNNNGGVFAGQSNRGSGSRGTFEIKNLWVHDNKISFNQGLHGLRVNDGGNVYYTGKNNRFDRNTYTIGETKPFYWMNANRTPQEWTNYGQDKNGTFA